MCGQRAEATSQPRRKEPALCRRAVECGMEFGVLGPLVVTGTARDDLLGGPKQRSLVALLLLNANGTVSRERLMAGIWGEYPPPSAEHTLDNYLSRVRKLFGTDRILRASGRLLPACRARGAGPRTLRVRRGGGNATRRRRSGGCRRSTECCAGPLARSRAGGPGRPAVRRRGSRPTRGSSPAGGRGVRRRGADPRPGRARLSSWSNRWWLSIRSGSVCGGS